MFLGTKYVPTLKSAPAYEQNEFHSIAVARGLGVCDLGAMSTPHLPPPPHKRTKFPPCRDNKLWSWSHISLASLNYLFIYK